MLHTKTTFRFFQKHDFYSVKISIFILLELYLLTCFRRIFYNFARSQNTDYRLNDTLYSFEQQGCMVQPHLKAQGTIGFSLKKNVTALLRYFMSSQGKPISITYYLFCNGAISNWRSCNDL